jgi:hypothetical protein
LRLRYQSGPLQSRALRDRIGKVFQVVSTEGILLRQCLVCEEMFTRKNPPNTSGWLAIRERSNAGGNWNPNSRSLSRNSSTWSKMCTTKVRIDTFAE